ncbi:hypothetical protein HKX48_000578 [Thoreauomyces humboldtii]|nr:hypothetical protein HKX48_000578 [Thoreauomyces humboldtii]
MVVTPSAPPSSFAGRIHFFDISSKGQGNLQSWSPATLRIRQTLNYKRIPYTESFLDYPDIARFYSTFSIPSNPMAGRPTLPAILHYDHDGVLVKAMGDSLPIAEYLDAVAPDAPQVVPRSVGTGYGRLGRLVNAALRPFKVTMPADVVISKIPSTLNERSRVWFVQDRRQGDDPLHRSPEDWLVGEDVDALWRAWEERGLRYLVDLLSVSRTEDDDDDVVAGPFLLGEKPVFADFVVAGIFTWFRRGSEDDFRRIMAVSPVLVAHYAACEEFVLGQGKVVVWDVERGCVRE